MQVSAAGDEQPAEQVYKKLLEELPVEARPDGPIKGKHCYTKKVMNFSVTVRLRAPSAYFVDRTLLAG